MEVNGVGIGSPQGFDLLKNASASGYGACALFFTNVTNSVKFDGGNIETAVGTCNDALSSDCVNALLKQATDVASNSSTPDMCETLLSEFTTNRVPQCSSFATGDRWQDLKVQGMSYFCPLLSRSHTSLTPSYISLVSTVQRALA